MRTLSAILFAALLPFVQGCEEDSPAGPSRPGGEGPDFSAFDDAIEASIAVLGLEGAAAVIVHRDFGIAHTRGYGAFAADRVFLIASAGKPISAGVLMRLDDQGLLDVDAPIGTYVAGRWGEEKAAITVAQLLSNSSGLVGLIEGPLYEPYRCQYSPAGALTSCAREIYEADDADDVVPPDTRFRYGGAQWQLAGGIAEVVSGKSWAELVRETYAGPCGTKSLGYANPFSSGSGFRYPSWFQGDTASLPSTLNPNIEGGAYITVEDYGKILLLHLRGGLCGDARVLSEGAVRRMREDRIGAVYGGETGLPGLEGYGLGWWIERADDGVAASPGLYGAIPWIDERRGYGAFIAIEGSAAERHHLWSVTRPILEEIFDGLNQEALQHHR
jgi:CubicO group peptidase (beta-lactamase class C family)